MSRKWFWIGVSLVAALAVAASVLLRDRSAPLPEDEGAEAPAQQVEAVRAAPETPALPAAPPSRSALEAAAAAGIAAAATGAPPKIGDLVSAHLSGDDLGYLDVDAIINRKDPSSIVAFLLAHRDETGADESLEIEIRYTLDYPTRKKVIFDQLIDGKHSIEGQGDILFDPATGAVHRANAWLVTPDPALAASIVILRDEAVAIARAAAASYVQPRLLPGARMTMDATAKELRYALDPETNKARAEWPVWVSADGFYPGLDWEVLVDASTGEIIGTRDLIEPWVAGAVTDTLEASEIIGASDLTESAAGACSDLTFRVCDGSTMLSKRGICAENGWVHPLPDADPSAARAIARAKDMTRDIKATDPSYIGAVRGSDCEVEIILHAPDRLFPIVQGRPAGGMYDPGADRILLPIGAGKREVVHEVMHALTKTRSRDVEHGLVTAAESLHMGGGWSYGNENYTGTPPFAGIGTHHSVAHAIYRIYGATDKDTAFKIVLASDQRTPTPTNAHRVIFEEAKDVGAEAAVTGIYKDMGIWPSQNTIDEIIEEIISDMENKTGPLQVPTRAEMEDKVEELVNERLSNGEFNQGTIIIQVGEKAEEYRLEKVEELEKAKEEYNEQLEGAMAQLTNEERAEIQGQYSDAQRKIQEAMTMAIAQWNWEWIRGVIEQIIEGREDEDVQVPVAPRSSPTSPPKKPEDWPPGWPRRRGG